MLAHQAKANRLHPTDIRVAVRWLKVELVVPGDGIDNAARVPGKGPLSGQLAKVAVAQIGE